MGRPKSRRAFRRWPALVALLVAPGTAAASVERARVEGWLAVAGPTFEVLTDAGAEKGSAVVLGLETFRSTLARLAPSLAPRRSSPLTVFAFRDAAAFAPYKGARDPTGGAILGQLVATVDGSFLALDAGSSEGGLSEVVVHELVHDVVRQGFPALPAWLNEGLAEHYSTFAIEDGAVRLGRPVERHLEWLRGAPDWGIGEVLRATGALGEGHETVAAGRFYAVSWALAHYLLAAPARLDRLAEVLARAGEGEATDDAFEEVFGLDARELEAAVRAFLETAPREVAVPLARLPPVASTIAAAAPADVAVRLGDLLAHLGRVEAAAAHFELALALEPEHPDAHAGLAFVRDLDGRRPEAAVLHDDARRLGSASAWSRVLYGRHLLVRAGEEAELEGELAARARTVLAEATSIDPSWGEAWVLLARAHLGAGGEAEAGLRALGPARRRLPDRPDVPFLAALFEIRLGRLDAAAVRIRDLVAVAPALAERAGGELEFARAVRAARAALAGGDAETGIRLLDEAVGLAPDAERKERLETEVERLRSAPGPEA